MTKYLLLTAIIFSCFKICHAQPGELDPSFGTNGIVTADLGKNVTNDSYGKQVLLQPDGGMYVVFQVGKYERQVLIAKRLPNGSPDISYGRGGYSVSVYMED